MNIITLSALILLAVGGFGALFLRNCERLSSRVGSWSAILAMLAIIVGCFVNLPYPEIASLAQFFRIIIAIIGAAAALHAPGYLEGHGKRVGFFWLFFNGTLGAMTLVTVCHSFLPFLLAWEAMGLASFALVAFEHHEEKTCRAAWIYLLSCEAGGLILMTGYALHSTGICSDLARVIIMLIGFGLKIGFPVLHVWLPEAHPAAPAPVSAIMSAAMIPLGFYGFLHFTNPFLVFLEPHFGWTFLILGLIGAFGGILFAMPQNNLKRLLAYSSVENMGIVSIGLGLGILGSAYDMNTLSICGAFGMALHIFNHALLKGTLFLGAGSVLKSTGTLQLDHLGGLMKRMPLTGSCFTLGSLGICGLPPFCGFTGELFIYLGAFYGIAHGRGFLFAACLVTAIVLALTGAIACATLVKATGAAFLGEPRTDTARNAKLEKRSMALPQIILIVLAMLLPVILGFAPKLLLNPDEIEEERFVASVLLKNAIFTLILYGVFFLVWLLRRRAGKDTRAVGTWDCGYAQPTARMEYTGTAFIQPLADQFKKVLGFRRTLQPPDTLFPEQASLETKHQDVTRKYFWNPLFKLTAMLASWIHRFQSGYLHLYILIMIIAIAALLIWAFLG